MELLVDILKTLYPNLLKRSWEMLYNITLGLLDEGIIYKLETLSRNKILGLNEDGLLRCIDIMAKQILVGARA